MGKGKKEKQDDGTQLAESTLRRNRAAVQMMVETLQGMLDSNVSFHNVDTVVERPVQEILSKDGISREFKPGNLYTFSIKGQAIEQP